jgi:Ser/Thr protein kinase RdoA (MazF antagonist)
MPDHFIRPDIYTEEFTELILRQYGLTDGAGMDIEPMPQGFGMALVRIRLKDHDLVVKQLNPQQCMDRIRFALHFHDRLHAAGLPCPRLFRTIEGHLLASVKNRFFCVQQWCAGERFQADDAGIEERRHHRQQLGTLLGQIHAAGSPELMKAAPASCRRPTANIFTRFSDVERGLPWSRGGPLARNLWLLCHESGAFAREIRKALPLLKNARHRLASSPLIKHPHLADILPVHGDFHFDNILFLDGQVAAILDFDNALLAPRAYDLGSSMAVICQEREHEDDFLTAYEAAGGSPLPDRDLLRACALSRLVNSLSFQIVGYTRRHVRSPRKARRWIRRLIRLLCVELESD